MTDEMNFCNTKNTQRRQPRGRPRLPGETLLICFRLRKGDTERENDLFDRMQELGERGQRSRVIRKILLTGEVEPVLDRVFQQETERVQQGLDAMFDLWEDDED